MSDDNNGEDSLDSITKMCDELEKNSSKSFLVQFYGVHEVLESFDHSNLLASQQFRDALDKVEKDTSISCFFVFQDLHAFVGTGVVARKEQEGDQEPFDITVNWTKLTVLPYKDLANNTVGEDIVRLIEDEDDLNWEIKEVSEDQAVFLENAIFLAAEETPDTLRARYEQEVQPYAHHADAEEEEGNHRQPEGGDAQDGPPPSHGDHETTAAPHHPTSTESGNQEGRSRAKSSGRDDEQRARIRSREPSSARGNYNEGMHDGYREPKRSRIPFDVTKMSYDQYCAKHYSYAIDMYRQEKLRIFQQQQALMAAGMMAGGAAAVTTGAGAVVAGAVPAAPAAVGDATATPAAAAAVLPGVGVVGAYPLAVAPGMPAGMMVAPGMMAGMMMPGMAPGVGGMPVPATMGGMTGMYGQPTYKP